MKKILWAMPLLAVLLPLTSCLPEEYPSNKDATDWSDADKAIFLDVLGEGYSVPFYKFNNYELTKEVDVPTIDITTGTTPPGLIIGIHNEVLVAAPRPKGASSIIATYTNLIMSNQFSYQNIYTYLSSDRLIIGRLFSKAFQENKTIYVLIEYSSHDYYAKDDKVHIRHFVVNAA
jgi:hypothetical protein